MNAQRLVAAVAALAIGFGITLVGVSIADDEIVADDSAGFDEEASEPDPDVEPVDAAEQDEERAEEPDAAEVEEQESPASDPVDQGGQSQEGVPVEPDPEPSPMEIEEIDDVDQFDLPRSGRVCVDVVSLPVDGDIVDFVFVSIRSQASIVLLGEEGPVIAELPADFDLDVVPRLVFFDEGFPVEFAGECADDESSSDPDGEATVDRDSLDRSQVPCDGIDLFDGALAVFDELSPAYGDALSVDDPSDIAGYRFLVAAVAERAADGSFASFLESIEATTTDFRMTCPFDIESFLAFELVIDAFIEDDFNDAEYDELLCNLGQLSGDARLIEFLAGRAEAFDTLTCNYEAEA